MQIILWFMIICFVVGFIFLAVGSGYSFFGKGGERDLIAKVGNVHITISEFNRICQPALDQLYSSLNQSPTTDEIKRLKVNVLNNLVDDTILHQAAQKLGVNVSDEEFMASIQGQPYFQVNGKFDRERYYKVLDAMRMTPPQFEAAQRQQLLTQKIRGVLLDSVLLTGGDFENFPDFLNRDLQAEYVVLDRSAFEKKVTYTKEDLQDYYYANRRLYDREERAKVRHILIPLAAGTATEEEKKIEKSLEEYRNQILSGKATFAELAKKYSQDEGSKNKGGDLGWLTRGRTVKEFESAVFNLKKGGISKPFKTQFGYHLAQLDDYEKEYKSTFAEVRPKVLKQYLEDKADRNILALSTKLAEKLKEKRSLKSAAGELSLPVKTTGWFNRNAAIPGLVKSEKIS
jgi:peptidyl-prolyl cis-trans isomerase D